MTGKLPPSASVAHSVTGAKLHAPAADRNADALLSLLRDHAPKSGRALEIASGTGQHVSVFAKALPDLHWQPTEIDPARRASIDAYVAEAALSNVAPAAHLDAATAGWSASYADQDLILLINLAHLIPETAVRTIIAGVAQALAPGGTFILYGPFKRDGRLTSPGDARFDAQLRAADPAIGYKDADDITAWLGAAGIRVAAPVEMPANNLAFVAGKPAV
jgi:SAM-dependent methyltransferase